MKKLRISFGNNQSATVSLPDFLLERCEQTFGKSKVASEVKKAITSSWRSGNKHQSQKSQEALLKLLNVGRHTKMLDGAVRLDGSLKESRVAATAIDKGRCVSVQIIPAQQYNSFQVWPGDARGIKLQTLRYLDGINALCVEDSGQMYKLLHTDNVASPFVVCGVVSLVEPLPSYAELVHEDVVAAWAKLGFSPKGWFLKNCGWSVQQLLKIAAAQANCSSPIEAATTCVRVFIALDTAYDAVPQILREVATESAAKLLREGKPERIAEISRFLRAFADNQMVSQEQEAQFTAAEVLAAQWNTTKSKSARQKMAAQALSLWMKSELRQWTLGDLAATAASEHQPKKTPSASVTPSASAANEDFKIKKGGASIRASSLAKMRSIVGSQVGLPV